MNKTDLLFQMMEHPQEYTAEAWQEILADEECRESYTLMSKTQSAFDAVRAVEKITDEMIDAEWQRLSPQHHSLFRNIYSGIKSYGRVAAFFIGLLLLSGITFAAIHIVRYYQHTQASQTADTTAVVNSLPATVHPSLTEDTITTPEPKLYDNIPLEQILTDLSVYYHINVIYRDDTARQLRLFYPWKPEYTIKKVVETLNNFEILQLRLDGETLMVSSIAE
ncbi:MAG: DUF4974 domain-containing protein [Prevotella sp.]|nr:DUF4974 domain-containing protein [Prevotella sp.]